MEEKDEKKEGLTNGQVYRKTFVFSGIGFLIDVLSLVVLIACTCAGYLVSTNKAIGLGVGLLVGLILLGIILHYVKYLYKAGQIAMMTKAVTEGSLPENVLASGKKEVKERFATVSAFFAVESGIKAIFMEISNGLNALGNMAGGETGGEIGSTISAVINTVVEYLCKCCLGWVFYKKGQNAFKSTCEGAVLFFKNWKALIRNLGRIFGMAILSFILIGGGMVVGFFFLYGCFPDLLQALSTAFVNASADLQAMSDPELVQAFMALITGIVFWCIIHSEFVKPFILVGVLRNYMKAGIENAPKESNFEELDKMSPKFKKMHEKAEVKE